MVTELSQNLYILALSIVTFDPYNKDNLFPFHFSSFYRPAAGSADLAAGRFFSFHPPTKVV